MDTRHHTAMVGASARSSRPSDLLLGALGTAGNSAPVATKEDAEQKPGAEKMNTNTSDCAASDAAGKAFSTMQARAAIRGCTLSALSGGGYLLSQWGYSREVPCLRAVGSLLHRMGA